MHPGQLYGQSQMDANSAGYMAQQNVGEKAKKSKKKIIIPIVAAAVVVVGVVLFFLLKGGGKESKEKNEALDRFFEAVERMDLTAINDACYPEGSSGREKPLPEAMLIKSIYSSTMGILIVENDKLRSMMDIYDMYLKSYGFDSIKDGGLEERDEAVYNGTKLKKSFTDFKISYDLVRVIDSDKVVFYDPTSSGRNLVVVDDPCEWMENHLNRKSEDSASGKDVKVTEVKVAIVNIHWSYGDKKYGYDEKWWNNSVFIDVISDIYGEWTDLPASRKRFEKVDLRKYDDLIEYMDDIEYEFILYKSDGEWYVFPERIAPPGGITSQIAIEY
ncbi:MAG: hypothetical protein K5750_09250 [Eubacterium sp.]|nr:hypothetical protein [Eubacterium sp.]